MFDRSVYEDIAPYDEKGCEEAVERILSHPEYIRNFALGLLPGDTEEAETKRRHFIDYVTVLLRDVHSYTDFQLKVTAGVFIPYVLKSSVKEFSSSGAEKLSPDESYLFVSNHRDIVLDCALLDYALMINNLPICEMAIGDNLLKNKFLEDLFKLNGAIVVRRDLPMREKYKESIRLSEYFVDRIASGKSIWVAQKSGRSKDGIDETHPSIIKMLYLSKRDSGISFSSLIQSVHIVPVAVSYEYDPNDINKGREEVRLQRAGTYEKKPLEDTISMLKGLRENKGNIHISFGTPLSAEYNTPDEVASEIDRQIHTLYRLWPTNLFSYDYLEHSDAFRKEYADFNQEAFLSKYGHLDDEVRTFVLQSYANPVRMYLRDKDKA